MRVFAAALALGLGLSGAAFADTMANAYENTIVASNANGVAVRYYFNADGTFSARTPDGAEVGGVYEIEGDQICITVQGGERGCTEYVGDKSVGDTWTQRATDGGELTITIEAGR